MSLAFKVFWIVSILELLMWYLPSLPWRRLIAIPIALLITAASANIFVSHHSVPTGAILLMSGYRVCNLLRLVLARMHAKYLQRMTVQTSRWIIVLQAITLGLWGLGTLMHLSTYHLWIVLLSVDLIGSLVLLSSAVRHVRTTQAPDLSLEELSDRNLPTLTVAIPARNETSDLEDCLESLLKSNYPKLEILALDDCSQNSRTPEIIRGFAHDGVRFIQGQQPESNWLAKNQAYQQLFEASSGELLLFCGVDVRFTADSLRQLVAAMIHKHKSMVSVIPKNQLAKAWPVYNDGALLQPMRYVWELALPRRLLNRPPVLSTCWIIKRETLLTAGGFAAVSRSIVPESYFARISAGHDGYSFMQSSDSMGITVDKRFAEQVATAIRTRYPQVHRRMELVLILTVSELVGALMPYALILAAIFIHLPSPLTAVCVATVVVMLYVYARIAQLTYRRWLLRSWLLVPLAVCLDIALLNYSMIRYEFFSVLWKGRNVCIPVMRLVDRLAPPH